MTTHNKIKNIENKMSKLKQFSMDKEPLIVKAFYENNDKFEISGKTYTKKKYDEITKSSGRDIITIMMYGDT